MRKIAEFFSKKCLIITISALAALLLFAAGFLWFIYPQGAIARGVFVENTDLSGMSVLQAEEALKRNENLDSEKLVLQDVTGERTEFSGLDILLSEDVKKTVDAAYMMGRSEDVFSNIIERVKLLIKPCDIGYRYSCDEEKLARIIYDFGVSVNGELTDYTLDFKNGYVDVSKGVAGQSKDISSVLETVKSAIDSGVYLIEVKMEKSEPPVPTVKGLMDYIYTEPVGATYSVNDGVVTITDEVNGKSVREEEVNEKISALIEGETIRLEICEIKPEITRRDLYNKLFNHTLGSFSSNYSTANKNRSQNVALASKLINGIVLAPGEIFSYNQTVGPRTASRGFREATMYSNGESVMGIGGGICQVSSTLYSAVLYSDLEIVQRQNHSMTVDYMPKGQDATVSYGTIDFKFRNNTKNPVKISSVASGGKLTVSLLGTRPDKEKEVKISNNTVSVIEKTVEQVEDATLSDGVVKTVSVGKTGYVIDTYKKVYEDGVLVKNEYVGRSKYRMVPQKRAVGKAPTATQAPAETTVPQETTAPVINTETIPETSEPEDTETVVPVFSESESTSIPDIQTENSSGTQNKQTEEIEN